MNYNRTILEQTSGRVKNYPKKLFTKGRTRQRLQNELKEFIPQIVISRGLIRYIESKAKEEETSYLFIDDPKNNQSYCIQASKLKGQNYLTTISIITPRFNWTDECSKYWRKEEENEK